MRELVTLGQADPGALDALGGKAVSLVRLMRAGLPVPGGHVLTTAFTAPWFARIRASEAWESLREAPVDAWAASCAAAQALVADLPLDDRQRAALDALGAAVGDGLVAVRSSSPEEDLEGTSFAGGYTTVPGVTREGLEEAVRRCFASSLDARVLRYKQQRGLDPFAPRLAVVAQRQLDSEIAGVAFSLDPVSNDYDRVVVDAAWGLGERVASGAVSPDHFVVDKVAGEVIARTVGAKGPALRVAPGGGVHEVDRPPGLCLSDARVVELAHLVARVEALFGMPVDVEWAVADGALHLLQARPITTWVPLPASMQTRPGAPRRLYMDLGLSGGLTLNEPLTPVGQSWMARFAGLLVTTYVGNVPFSAGPGDELWFLDGGRMYQELSNVLWLATPRMIAMGQDQTDAAMAATLRSVDRATYRARRRPAWITPWILVLYPRAVWRLRFAALAILRDLLRPDAAAERYRAELTSFRADMAHLPDDWDADRLVAERAVPVMRHVLETTMPALLASMVALKLIEVLVPRRHRDAMDALTRGYPGNAVIRMGVALRTIADALPADTPDDPRALAARLAARELPEPVLKAWDAFVARFGWRGPHEVDLGRPRFGDAPELALSQVLAMRGAAFDPARAVAEHATARRQALARVLADTGTLRRSLLRHAHRVAERFAGTRDDPKHHYLMLFAALRERVLTRGRALHAAGRLDAPEDAVNLTLEELAVAGDDPSLDLRARAAHNTVFTDLLRRVVRSFPPVIDSRGRIVTPDVGEAVPGEHRGMAVSSGVARGPARVLRAPDATPVREGDILVAHTTDPGWTPLFVNAAAVVLGVGGVLQHGAIVAREYGKPCVAGLADVLDTFHDDMILEVDGTRGVVRVVEESARRNA